MNSGNIIALYRELKRRRLFRTIFLYVIVAWGVVAAMDIFLPQFVPDPEAAMRYVFIAAFLLFPVAAVFSWFYDLTEQGIKRTPSFSRLAHDPGSSLHRIDYMTILLLITIAGSIITFTFVKIAALPGARAPLGESQIVVMPFSTCAGQPEDKLMAGGLVLELIGRLGEYQGIRTTTVQNLSAGPLQIIRRPQSDGLNDLNRLILDGEVCRQGNGLVLKATLSDAQGKALWCDTLENLLQADGQTMVSLASSAASSIARRLGRTVTNGTYGPIQPLAYEQLLVGLQWRQHGNNTKARAAFERALQYQPDFAEALLELGLLNIDAVGYQQKNGIEQAMPYASQALALALEKLENGEATARTYFVAGKITAAMARWESELLWRQSGELDETKVGAAKNAIRLKYAQAERYLRTAMSLNPSATATYVELANAIEQQGLQRRGEALAILETGWARHPLDLSISARLAKRLAARGQFRRAIEILQYFNELPEVPSGAWWWQLELMTLNSYMDEKCETLIRMLQNDPDAFKDVENRWQIWWFLSQLAYMGLTDEAEAWRERLENMPLQAWMRDIGLRNYWLARGKKDELVRMSQKKLAEMRADENFNSYYEWLFVLSHGLALNGELQQAIELIESTQHAPGHWHEREMLSSLRLAALYVKAGQAEKAGALLENVVTHLETEVTLGVRHPTTLAMLSFAYLHQGRQEESINMLRRAVDYHWRMPCEELGNLGWYWPFTQLNDDPRIVDICNRMTMDITLQGQRVREMLAQHDPDELLAPLMTMGQ